MALGVLSALHQRGVAVPGQISVIGYDDTYESAFFHPALTIQQKQTVVFADNQT